MFLNGDGGLEYFLASSASFLVRDITIEGRAGQRHK